MGFMSFALVCRSLVSSPDARPKDGTSFAIASTAAPWACIFGSGVYISPGMYISPGIKLAHVSTHFISFSSHFGADADVHAMKFDSHLSKIFSSASMSALPGFPTGTPARATPAAATSTTAMASALFILIAMIQTDALVVSIAFS